MEVLVSTVEDASVVAVVGEIDGRTAPIAQEQILAQVQPNGKLILDMSGVEYMSSAGLRVMLNTYRQASSKNTKVVLVGLSEMLEDTMSATGFLRFFTTYDTVAAALEGLK